MMGLGMSTSSPLHWPVAELREAYRRRELTPVEVTEEALSRSRKANSHLNAFLCLTDGQALAQAHEAESAYRRGDAGPLAGIPLPIKDTFAVAGTLTTFGSLVHAGNRATDDCGLVSRLRAAGAVFTGKTNTAEFGQSATTDNLLGDDCRNPWDLERTPGGSSGGATAAVAAGLAGVAIGTDGGGSVRIPAAFCGLFGFKPTYGLCADEGGFRAMSEFISPGPFAWRVADVRPVLSVVAEMDFCRTEVTTGLKIGWCPQPEGRPVDLELLDVVSGAAGSFAELGHRVEETELPLSGWDRIFGPLVIEEEGRERGGLLDERADDLTEYELASLTRARDLSPAEVAAARAAHPEYRARIDGLFDRFDVLAMPATAVPAFRLGERPSQIAGQRVSRLWGAFPFAVPFNVSGHPAASLNVGTVDGLPVGVQLVGRRGGDRELLDLCEQLEDALAVNSDALRAKWQELTA